MLFLLAQIVAAGLIIIGLYDLRKTFGLSLLFIFVCANQFMQNLLVATVYVDVLGTMPISPGSSVLFSSGLFALLLVYVKEDIPKTRQLLYGIALANLSIALIVVSTRWGLLAGVLTEASPAADWFRYYSLGLFFTGMVLLFLDAFLIIVIYELLTSRTRWMPQWVRFVVSLCLVFAFDSIAFVGLSQGKLPGTDEIFIGNLLGKVAAGVIYGALVGIYLEVRAGSEATARTEIRDPFSILTYRERYRELEAEKKEMERAHEQERRRAQVALEGAQLGLWDWNIESGETFLDERWAAMLGYTREEVVPAIGSWESRVHPEDMPRVREVLEDHLEGRRDFYQVEHRLLTKSGEWKWILTMGKALERDDSGRALRMSGAHLDIDERKNAELALAESERRYELATEAAKVGVWDWDLSTNEIFVDPRLKALLGFEDHEIPNRLEEWGRRVHPHDADRVMAEASAHIEGRTPRYEVEHRMLHKDGSVRWFLAQGSVLRRPDGTAEKMIGTDTDITQRKEAEKKLEETEQRYRELFEYAPLMYVTTGDREGVPFVSDCNATFLEALEYEREEVIGRPLGDFYTEESRGELLGKSGYRIALSGRSVVRERQLVTKSGRVLSTILQAQPEVDTDGEVVGTRSMFVDISKRVRAERALKQSEERLAEAQQVASLGSWDLDFSTGELHWSDENYRIFGVDPNTFQPSPERFFELVHPDDRERIQRREDASAPGAEPFALDHRIIRPDGTCRTLHTEVRWVVDGEGKSTGLHGTTQDVTELRRGEAELRASREELRRLAASLEAAREEERAMIAREIHDELGQALTGLKMDLTSVKRSLGGRHQDRVEAMARLVDQTIDAVRDLSSRLRPSVLDDLGLCEAIEWQVKDFSRRSGIECRQDLDEDCHDIPSEVAVSVFRVLQEALTNVARHAEASEVDVALFRDGARLELRVQDNGKGIERERLEGGFSLGLVGMRERIAEHGGDVSVEPLAGGGTLVSVSVPL